jgi:hypothetical protein
MAIFTSRSIPADVSVDSLMEQASGLRRKTGKPICSSYGWMLSVLWCMRSTGSRRWVGGGNKEGLYGALKYDSFLLFLLSPHSFLLLEGCGVLRACTLPYIVQVQRVCSGSWVSSFCGYLRSCLDPCRKLVDTSECDTEIGSPSIQRLLFPVISPVLLDWHRMNAKKDRDKDHPLAKGG